MFKTNPEISFFIVSCVLFLLFGMFLGSSLKPGLESKELISCKHDRDMLQNIIKDKIRGESGGSLSQSG